MPTLLRHPIVPIGGLEPFITQKFGADFKMKNGQLAYKSMGMNGHNGIDYRTVYATSPLGHLYIYNASNIAGTIQANYSETGYGNHVKILHDDGSQTIYGHLSKIYVKTGDRVLGWEDKPLGLTGNSGFSTASHLHFGYRPPKFNASNGYYGWIDPLPMIKPFTVELSNLDEKDIKHEDYHDKVVTNSELKKWVIPYREQGNVNSCVAMSITNALYAITGVWYSALALYTEIESDPVKGVKPKIALQHMFDSGLILESKLPYGDPWKEEPEARILRAEAYLKTSKDKRKSFSFTNIQVGDKSTLDHAISFTTPVLCVIRTYKGGDEGIAFTGQPGNGRHMLVLTEKLSNDLYKAKDTLRRSGDDQGDRVIHVSNMLELWGLVPEFVPAEIRDTWENRYGKEKDSKAELKANAQIVDAIQWLKRPDLWNEYVRNQAMYRNAVAYGGYNVSYYKLLRTWPGDIINYMHAKLNGLPLPFDLNKQRPTK